MERQAAKYLKPEKRNRRQWKQKKTPARRKMTKKISDLPKGEAREEYACHGALHWDERQPERRRKRQRCSPTRQRNSIQAAQ
jgi:hypothetical protein